MPLSGDASGPAEEVPSPTRSPHARPSHHCLPPRSARLRCQSESRNRRRCRGRAVARRAAPHSHASSALAAPASPPRGPAPRTRAGRLHGAGLGRAGRTPAPCSLAKANQARHKLPRALAEASRAGRSPAPLPPARRRLQPLLPTLGVPAEIGPRPRAPTAAAPPSLPPSRGLCS